MLAGLASVTDERKRKREKEVMTVSWVWVCFCPQMLWTLLFEATSPGLGKHCLVATVYDTPDSAHLSLLLWEILFYCFRNWGRTYGWRASLAG